MKIDTSPLNVARSAPFPEKTFTIANTAKAFEILSSRLYTNTRLAIVRELSTNAYDSHVAAGKADMPFNVHLPNTFAPYFSIRDFGTGLSPDAVESIYTTYFASTRNDSNDFVGALGLGSKSPFSYTDQFTVSSYYDGTVYTYSAFKNERSEPTIALLSAQPTTEPNGVEIKINIKTHDATDFQVAARQVYRFFPVFPNISGAKFELPVLKHVYEGDSYKIYQRNTVEGFSSHLSVVMGNICYPVNHSSLTHKLRNLGALVLFVNIGDVEIAASREELHYDARTLAAIQERINAAQIDIKQQIMTDLGQDRCTVDRLRALRYRQEFMEFDYRVNEIPTEVKDQYSLKRVEMKGEKLFVGRDQFQERICPDVYTQYAFIEIPTFELAQSDKSRLRHWMSTNAKGGTRIYVAVIEDRTEFLKVFGEPTANLADLPEPPRKPSRQFEGSRTFVKKYRTAYRNRLQDMWENVETDTVDIQDAIAVRRHGSHVIINDNTMSPSEAMKIAEKLGYTKLYGVAVAYYDRIRKELGLPDLDEEAREWITDVVTNATDFQRARQHHGFDSYTYESKFMNAIKGLSTTCENLRNLSKISPLDAVTCSMIAMFGLTLPKAPNYQDEFKKRYPLLSAINLSYAKMSDITEYITLKENNVTA